MIRNEEEFSLALEDIKNVISCKGFRYLTSILSRDEPSSEETIGERNSINWSGSSDRSGTLSSVKTSGEISGEIIEDDHGVSDSSRGSRSSRAISVIVSGEDIRRNGGGIGSGSDDNLENLGYHREEDPMMVRKSKNVLTVSVPYVVEERKEHGRIVGRHLHFSSLQQKPVGITPQTKYDALCSHLFPVCRKILSKTPQFGRPPPTKTTTIGKPLAHLNEDMDGNVNSLSVSEIAEKDKSCAQPKDIQPYQVLIGKISETKIQRDFARNPVVTAFVGPALISTGCDGVDDVESLTTKIKRKRKTKATAGVCNLSHAISNPLYKCYHPKGYVKSEDEIAREHIQKSGQRFNEWLKTLEGVPMQLDTQLLTRILRHDLELPDINSIEHLNFK